MSTPAAAVTTEGTALPAAAVLPQGQKSSAAAAEVRNLATPAAGAPPGVLPAGSDLPADSARVDGKPASDSQPQTHPSRSHGRPRAAAREPSPQPADPAFDRLGLGTPEASGDGSQTKPVTPRPAPTRPNGSRRKAFDPSLGF